MLIEPTGKALERRCAVPIWRGASANKTSHGSTLFVGRLR
jgi:hypothetical protein